VSQENVEVVRRFLATDEGEDVVPRIRAAVRQLGPDFAPDAVLAFWAEDPAMKHVHPDVEWHSTVTGLSAATHGPSDVTRWLVAWSQAWESLVNRVAGYRDLGEWVLVSMDTQARGRDGIALEMRRFHLYSVRDGKVATFQSFGTEQDALKAVGLEN
jgi:ketosteroid isomerase-like protein